MADTAHPQTARSKREKPDIPASERLAYPILEACAVSGIGRSKIYESIRTNELRSVKRAGRRLIMREDLVAFLNGQTQADAA